MNEEQKGMKSLWSALKEVLETYGMGNSSSPAATEVAITMHKLNTMNDQAVSFQRIPYLQNTSLANNTYVLTVVLTSAISDSKIVSISEILHWLMANQV